MTEFLTHHRKKLFIVFLISALLMVGLCAQLGFLMIARSDHYSKMADELHKRERTIKAARGEIVDRNGTVIAANRTVCTVSVIHNQVTEPEKVIRELVRILELPEPEVRKKVEKWSSREIIRTNVEKSAGDQIMNLGLSGVKVDEDYKRYYPYGSLASKVLGFTGADNQGIIGLEVKYERYLKGRDGLILTTSDAKGTELQNAAGGAGRAGARKYPDREPGCEHPEVRGAGGVPGHGEKRCEGGLRDRHGSPEWGDLRYGKCPGV